MTKVYKFKVQNAVHFTFCDDIHFNGFSIMKTYGFSTQYIGSNIFCQAEKACTNAILESENTTWCTSKASCHDATITALTVHARGSFGAYEAIISAANVIGAGFFSFRKAQIDSEGIELMQVTMSGFKSGYKADVYCRPGSRCYVDCTGNACQQLNLKCYDGSECHVTPAGCEPDGGKKKVNDVHCPIWRELVTTGYTSSSSSSSASMSAPASGMSVADGITPQDLTVEEAKKTEAVAVEETKPKTKSKSVLGPLPKHKSALIQHTEDMDDNGLSVEGYDEFDGEVDVDTVQSVDTVDAADTVNEQADEQEADEQLTEALTGEEPETAETAENDESEAEDDEAETAENEDSSHKAHDHEKEKEAQAIDLEAELEDGGTYSDIEDRLYGYDDDDDDDIICDEDIYAIYAFDGQGEEDSDNIELTSPETSEGHLLCDQYRECVSQKSSSDFVYCFGYEACDGMVVEADGVSDSEVQCYAADSCQNADIVGVRSVQCNAKWSCREAIKVSTQSTNGLIACNGLGSCVDVVGTLSGFYVSCAGAGSCRGSVVKSFMYAQCSGKEACLEAHIVSGIFVFCSQSDCHCLDVYALSLSMYCCLDNDAVYCMATRACAEATISGKEVLCSGDRSCEYGEIQANVVKSFGAYSSAYSVIDATTITAYGYYSMSYSDVDSVNRATLSVKLWGDYSGYGTTLVCRSGSECSLSCKGTGCMGAEMLCLYGSKCSVDPMECEPNDATDIVHGGDWCPKWRSASTRKDTIQVIEQLEASAHRFDFGDLKSDLVRQRRWDQLNVVLVSALAIWLSVGVAYLICRHCASDRYDLYEPIK